MTALTMTSPPPPPPPQAASSSSSPTAGDRNAMHIDLSGVPGLVTPAPPSNTLLITNLNNLAIFAPSSLQAIRTHIEAEVHERGAIHAFAPLKAMRRIIVSFTSIDAAVALRRALDGTELLGSRARLYFGEPTPIEPARATHLAAPAADKLFFISPPPSPPHGWTMRNEEPPNKEVHAADLATALAHLDPNRSTMLVENDDDEQEDTEMLDAEQEAEADTTRSRRPTNAATTVVFEPQMHGGAAGLPAVLVEDTTCVEGPRLENEKKILEHTARPPVELME